MYETIVVLNPNTSNEDVENKISDWTQLVKEFGAETKRVERWGKRNLAFDIKKFHQGIFILFHIDGKNEAIVELERRFKIAEDVIRYQTVKLTALEYKTSNELLDSLKSQQHDENKKISMRSKDLDVEDLDDEEHLDTDGDYDEEDLEDLPSEDEDYGDDLERPEPFSED
ncbi:MAG: 30S ribosomal protein S6 [bacterium]